MHAARAGPLLLGAALLLLGAVLVAGEGTSDARLAELGFAAVVLTGAAAAVVALGVTPCIQPTRTALAFVGLLAGFVAWSGLTILWSLEPGRSWDYFNRDLVYLAFAVLGIVSGGLARRSPALTAAGLVVLLAVVLGWALAGKVEPSLFPDGARRARLREPVEYWNALALLAAIALVLGLWAAGRWHRPAVRACGAVLGYAAVVTLVLTYSRGGLAVAVLAALAWVVLSRGAFDAVAALVVLGLPATVVSAIALQLPGVADDGQPYSVRVGDGRIFGAVFAAGAVAVGLAALLASRREQRKPPARQTERIVVRAAAALAAVVLVAAAGAAVARAGGPGAFLEARWADFKAPEADEPGRLGSLSQNNRLDWWREAGQSAAEAPLGGRGAGTFQLVHRLERDNAITVTQPHDLPLQVLTDTGLVGFALLTGAFVAAGTAVVGTVRRLSGRDRGAALAVSLAAAAYVAHSLVDFDWDFVAVSAPAFFLLGLLAGAGPGPVERRRQPGAAGAAVALAAACVVSLGSPWLAARRVDDAYAALFRGDAAEAADRARTARSLNPLSLEAHVVGADAERARGDRREAYRLLLQAVDLEPRNPDVWFARGAFELRELNRRDLARRSLLRSVRLDPHGAGVEVRRLLAEARQVPVPGTEP
jgi:hypothetical protein